MSPKKTDLTIRLATLADAAGIVEIYAPYVRDTALTFETTVPTTDVFVERMTRIQRVYPFLVCISDDQVVGYAYANESRSREAYRWNVELSVYVHENWHRRGIATALYTALFQLVRAQGFVNMYAVIAVPNEASILLHKRFGFSEIGVFIATGYKFGQWHDVMWMQLRVDGALDPAEHGSPTPIDELHRNEVETAINLASALLK